MTTQYRNNLQKGDRVMHAENRRVGEVKYAGETSVWAGVVWQGTKSPQQTHVSKLRLVVNGKPEDVPPIDGEIPDGLTAPRIDPSPAPDGLAALRSERRQLNEEMQRLNDAYRIAKTRSDRIDKAIAVLEGKDVP